MLTLTCNLKTFNSIWKSCSEDWKDRRRRRETKRLQTFENSPEKMLVCGSWTIVVGQVGAYLRARCNWINFWPNYDGLLLTTLWDCFDDVGRCWGSLWHLFLWECQTRVVAVCLRVVRKWLLSFSLTNFEKQFSQKSSFFLKFYVIYFLILLKFGRR